MKWMLVDGNNWFARDYYATRHSPRADPAEQFLKRLVVIRNQYEFNRLICAWDSSNSFRKKLFTHYKAHRNGKSDEFVAALRRVQSIATDTIDCAQVDGFEADDLLATFTAIAHHEGARVVLCSNDKDLHQLLLKGCVSQVTDSERASANTYALKTVTYELFTSSHGITPDRWVDYRVIAGDKSDGIKGVPGLGPDVALKVMSRCATLEQFARSPFSVPITDRQRNLLIQSRSSWPDLRRLLTLRADVPLPASWFAELHGAT